MILLARLRLALWRFGGGDVTDGLDRLGLLVGLVGGIWLSWLFVAMVVLMSLSALIRLYIVTRTLWATRPR